MSILEDLNEVEIKIRIKPDEGTYSLEIDTIKISLLRDVLATIISSIDDGSILRDENINTYDNDPGAN